MDSEDIPHLRHGTICGKRVFGGVIKLRILDGEMIPNILAAPSAITSTLIIGKQFILYR